MMDGVLKTILGISVVVAIFAAGGFVASVTAQPEPATAVPVVDVVDCSVRVLASFTGNTDKLALVDLLGNHKGTKGFDPQLAKLKKALEAVLWCEALQDVFATGGPAD